jgi:hypothetical protein
LQVHGIHKRPHCCRHHLGGRRQHSCSFEASSRLSAVANAMGIRREADLVRIATPSFGLRANILFWCYDPDLGFNAGEPDSPSRANLRRVPWYMVHPSHRRCRLSWLSSTLPCSPNQMGSPFERVIGQQDVRSGSRLCENAPRPKTRVTSHRSWTVKRQHLAELCSHEPAAGKLLRGKSRRLRFYTASVESTR